MAQDGFFHCSLKPVGRATGRSAVAAAAYRAGQRLHDERTGLTHDYARKGGVLASFIVTPADAPDWAQDRAALWNAAEAATVAKNGRIATELELALPHELTADQRRELVEKFARELADRYRVAVDVAIHAPGKGGDHRNHHAHVMVTHRELGPEGFGAICNRREIERKHRGTVKPITISGFTTSEDTQQIRAAWAGAINAAYADAGLDIRADHRSHRERGLSEEPTKHLGPSAMAMERRGERSELGDKNRATLARNTERAQLEAERMSVTAAIAELVAERAERADRRELRAAIRSTSAQRILEAMTDKRATFTRAELVRLLGRGVDDKKEARALAGELLAHPDVIGLRETAADAVTRYTTREVLAAERQVLSDARTLAGREGYGIAERHRNAALRERPQLDEEQREALVHATGRDGFAMIRGEAGTGKTTTVAAIRDAYERAGFRVIGMAHTNMVVRGLKADGFKEVVTLTSGLNRLASGADRWNRKTVIIVDEAAMLSSAQLGRLERAAVETGAKPILVGDDRQLASIERGGLFTTLAETHGAAELHTVYRVKDQEQKAAYNLMHRGRFGEALDLFDRAGAIKWTQTQDEALAALVAQWAADTAAEPDKSRFVFAYTNADVAAVNADLRAIRRARGELGPDHVLATADGPTAFAAGDRVQFTATAWKAADKARGLVSGAVGRIEAIQGARVTVALDVPEGQKPQLVSFTVGPDAQGGQFDGLRHGYAGTIYKGQGATLDQTYLYHSQHWRAASAYVALSRHRESARLYVAREVTTGAEPWTIQEGGLAALDKGQRAAAERAYEVWAEENPGPATRYGLGEYVAYVQDKQTERGRSAYDMAQLVRQVSRTDETRAASQFVAGEIERAEITGERPRLSGPIRFDAMKAAAKRAGEQLAAFAARRRNPAPANKYAELKDTPRAAPAPDELGDFKPTAARAEIDKRRREERERQKHKGRDL